MNPKQQGVHVLNQFFFNYYIHNWFNFKNIKGCNNKLFNFNSFKPYWLKFNLNTTCFVCPDLSLYVFVVIFVLSPNTFWKIIGFNKSENLYLLFYYILTVIYNII